MINVTSFVLLVVGYFVVQWAIPDLVNFLVIAAASFGIIMVVYEYLIGRVNILRILFGMKPQARLQAAPLPGASPGEISIS